MIWRFGLSARSGNVPSLRTWFVFGSYITSAPSGPRINVGASRAGNLRLSVENALTTMRGEVPESVKNPEVLPTWRGRAGSSKATEGAKR